MKHFFLLWSVVLLGALLVVDPAATAEGNGQDDLDRATEAKLGARSIDDLSEVIRLAESAMKKGLDATNSQFAKRLLGSTLLQRAQERIRRLATNVISADDVRQRRQAVVSDLERALEYDPKQPQVYILLARLSILPEGGGVKKAMAFLDKAIEVGGADSAAKARALVFRSTLQMSPEKKRADLDEAVRLMPDDAATLRARGLILAEMNQLDLALADLNKAAELNPTSSSIQEEKGVVLAQLKKYDEAIAAFDKARQLNPQSLGPLVQRAKIHSLQEKYDAAIEDLNQALAIDSGNFALLLLRAGVYQDKGDREKAMADMDEALKLQPNMPMVIRTRALFLAQNERLNEAIGEMEKLAKRDPKDTLTLHQLAMFYAAKKNSAKAIETYHELLRLKPDDWAATRGLGDALLNVGQHAEAIALYEKAVKLQPKDEGLLNNLAWVLCTSPDDKLRNGRRAIELATEACEVTKYKVPHILSTLAAAYAEIGDFQNAIKWIDKGLEIAEKAKKGDKEGDQETKDALKKELENYKAKKPTRELLSEGKPDEKKPDEKK